MRSMGAIVIYPGRIITKVNKMNKNLDAFIKNVEDTKKALNGLNDHQKELMGTAWDQARTYIDTVQGPMLYTFAGWARELQSNNERYKSAAQKLPSINCLDKEALECLAESYQRKIDAQERRRYPNYSMIWYYESMKTQVERKLAAIELFCYEVETIYNPSDQLTSMLYYVSCTVESVTYNPASKTLEFHDQYEEQLDKFQSQLKQHFLSKYGITEEELKEAEEKGLAFWEVLAVWAEMENRGITKAEIEKMRKLGYSVADLAGIWKELKSVEGKMDQEFFSCLMKGTEKSYREAFQIDPDDLSPQMMVLLVDITNRMLEHDEMESLEGLINGILYTDKEHSHYPN